MRAKRGSSGNSTIRFDEDVRQGLDEYCRRSRRPLNSAVNYLITEALTAKGQWPPQQQTSPDIAS